MELLSRKERSHLSIFLGLFSYSFSGFCTLHDIENPPFATTIETPRDGSFVPLAQVVPLAEVVIDTVRTNERKNTNSEELSLNEDNLLPSISAKQKFFYNIQNGRSKKVARSIYVTLINEIVDKLGRSPLHVAVQNNQIEIVKLFLALKVNPYREDSKGYIPLHYAKRFNYQDIEKNLKKAGKRYYRKLHRNFWKQKPLHNQLPQV